ncbi:MAG: phage integrase N-terminal SAM-like domain-containing protein, partial [bacterium]|nr:phage integrase N-terminal SAM-like domain-containing protein [bacterium]
MPYSPDRLEKIKTLTGRKWDETHNCWAIPRTKRTIARLKALFSGDQILVDRKLKGATPKPLGWQPAFVVSPGPPADLLRVFEEILRREAYSPHTIKIYTFHARRFLRASGKMPADLSPMDFLTYFHRLENQNAAAYVRQAVRALKTLCRLALVKSPEFVRE